MSSSCFKGISFQPVLTLPRLTVIKLSGSLIALIGPASVSITISSIFRSSITIKLPQSISDTLELRQSFIGRVKDRKITYINSKKDDSYIYANISSLGKYIISRDTIKPEIKPINFKQNSNISDRSSIRLRLKDDVSGIKSYNAFLNGKWALFEYDPKSNLIFHKISDNIINKGENILLINFQDGVGNKGVYRATLYY